MLHTKGVNVDPGSLNDWLIKNGGYASGAFGLRSRFLESWLCDLQGCDIIWSKADSFGKTKFQGVETASESAICTGVSQGHGVIVNVNVKICVCQALISVCGLQQGHHWVLVTGCRGGGVLTVNGNDETIIFLIFSFVHFTCVCVFVF